MSTSVKHTSFWSPERRSRDQQNRRVSHASLHGEDQTLTLHLMRDLINVDEVAKLAHNVAAADAAEFRNQYPAYAADIAQETQKAITALTSNPIHRNRYESFITAMVYGEKPAFVEALGTVQAITKIIAWQGVTSS